jgi:hypothetical protein
MKNSAADVSAIKPQKMRKRMKKLPIQFIPCAAVGFIAISGLSGGAQTVIFSDNFNTANTSDFDSAPLTGRLSGLDASLVYGQSGGVEMGILNDQLQLVGQRGEIRFNNSGETGATAPDLFDWSTGAGGAAIIAAGGMTISFNLTTPDTTDAANWISVSVGAANADDTGAAPRVNNANNSAGILFRDTGGTAIFNNGVEQTGGEGSITTSGVNHVISITYDFTSWAAGTPVTMTATEDGTVVGTDSFAWDDNYQYMDIGSDTDQPGTDYELVGDFTVSTVPEPMTWAVMAAALGLLVATRRLHRLQA